MKSFTIQYVGGIGRVTGSCTLVEKSGTQFLVDCGLIQGEPHSDFENKKEFPFNPRKIKFIILTHAHLDHCGLIPRLSNEGFVGKIYCTEATRKLSLEILKDCAKITHLYDKRTIEKLDFVSIDKRDDFKWGHLTPIDNDLMLALYRSAHILGSTSVSIADRTTRESVWFSGDIGRNCRDDMSQPLLKYRQGPDIRSNLVICESTYGAKTEPSPSIGFQERQSFFQKLFEETFINKSGDIVIPAFSLQRTQDILTDLFLLFNNKPELCGGINVVCDSPLAKRISKIYADEIFTYNDENGEKNYKYLNPELLLKISENPSISIEQLKSIFSSKKTTIGLHEISWGKATDTLNQRTVYLSSAGMCDAGPVVDHLKLCLPHKKNTIVLTGYQAKGTVGSTLINIMNKQTVKKKPLYEDHDLTPSDVHADIQLVNYYSGHADKNGILNYLFNTKRGYCPSEIHLNHGDDFARHCLSEEIQKHFEILDKADPNKYKKPNVSSPKINSTYIISSGSVEMITADDELSTVKSLEHELLESQSTIAEMQATIDRLKKNVSPYL